MKKYVVLLLFMLSTQLFAFGEFTNALLPPRLTISQEPSIIVNNQLHTELQLIEDTNMMIAAAPALIFTEVGISSYVAITKPMIDSQMLAMKKLQAANLILQVATGKKVRAEDLKFLTDTYGFDSSTWHNSPFTYIFGSVAGRIIQKIPIIKIDIANEEGINFFMAFPVSDSELTINGETMPPLVFIEYGSLLMAYTLDVTSGQITFLDPKKRGNYDDDMLYCPDHNFEHSYFSKQYCSFFKNEVPLLAQKHKKEFLINFSDFLKGKFNAQ